RASYANVCKCHLFTSSALLGTLSTAATTTALFLTAVFSTRSCRVGSGTIRRPDFFAGAAAVTASTATGGNDHSADEQVHVAGSQLFISIKAADHFVELAFGLADLNVSLADLAYF